MRAVDRKLTFWMAGYYDDFIGARAIPDDLNIQGQNWKSSVTHHGNPLNGWANLNPRYTYAWCERGDGQSGRFNNDAITTDNQYKHNNSINEWLGYDQNRRNAGKYEGVARPQYLDSLTNANRQRFDGGTGILGEAYKSTDAQDAFLLFSYGYNSSSRYYSAIGTNDSSFGRAVSYAPDYDFGINNLNGFAGMPVTGSTSSFSPTALITPPTTFVHTHTAGVYMGEVPVSTALKISLTQRIMAKAYLYPIQSPAGKPFLISEVYTTSATYVPILSFDGSLNSKGDGDIFTIRMLSQAVDPSLTRFKLSIGCEGSAFTSSSSGDTAYTGAAITLEITPTAYLEHQDQLFEGQPTMESLWDDYDFVIDYTAYTYTLYKNGSAVVTNQAMNAKAGSTNFTAADMYGWMIEGKECSKKAAVLIDRVGLVRPLNDYPSGLEMPPAVSMAYTSTVNSVSTLNLTLVDDDAQLKLLDFFSSTSYADWSLLMFRDNVDRPLWRGSVNSLDYSMNASERTPTIKLSANDYFATLDQQIPTWELGNSGDADSTEIVAYNRSEAQNNLNTYYFGATALVSANATLGFNEIDDSVFVGHRDSRMTNRSAHPIQMYGNEDAIGPNTPYADWDAAMVAGAGANPIYDAQYRALHSRWMQDFKNSLWFKHMFGRIEYNATTTTLSSAFSVGDTTIALTDYCGEIANGGSIEIISADGVVDSGVVTGGFSTVSDSIVAVDWTGQGVSAAAAIASFYTTPALIYHWFPILYIPNNTANYNAVNNKSITLEGFTGNSAQLNGNWRSQTQQSYHSTSASPPSTFPTNNAIRNGVNCIRVVLSPVGSTSSTMSPLHKWNYTGYNYKQKVKTGTRYYTNPTGVTGANIPTGPTGQQLDNLFQGDIWATEPTSQLGTFSSGGMGCTAPATNFFQRAHSAGTTVKIRRHTDDYKHVWVQWADMRNDGSANADAGLRKNKFGLMAPYASNYQVAMVLADSTVSNDTERQEFVDLSIGTDIELWEMDATKDPITGNTWSSVNSDSFTPTSFHSSDNTRYQQWQNKAGAFIFLDASKFFNLNTESNGGRTGQSSGGRKEVGDYLVETEGFPVLIDNYWEKAPTGPYNLHGGSSAYWNTNYKSFNSRTTSLLVGIESGNTLIQLTEDIINFPASGSVVGMIRSQSREKVFHFNATSQVGSVSGMTITAGAQGFVKITGTSSTVARYQQGQKIIISNSTCTPTIDGQYEIIADNGTHTPSGWELQIPIDSSVTLSSGGTATVAPSGATYVVDSVVDLGVPVAGTSARGEWNGFGYGTGANDAEYLMTVYSPYRLGGSGVDIPIDEDSTGDTYSDASVHVGLANVFPMRLMMQVDGFIENKASYTFNENDKFRVTWLDSLTQNWLTQSALYGTPSIASIPVTGNMTTTQKGADDGQLSGRILGNTATLTIGSYAGKVQISNGAGMRPLGLTNGDTVEIIDCFGLSLAADSYRTQYVVSGVGDPLSNVFYVEKAGVTSQTNKGWWRKVGSEDTFGSTNDCRNTTIANIFSTTQTGSGIGDTHGSRSVMSWLMGRDSQPSFRPTYSSGFVFDTTNLRVSNISTESSSQISNVRVFYNGSTSYVDYPAVSLGQRPRWDIINVDNVTNANEALIIAKQEYEKNKMAPFAVTAEIIRFSDSHTMNGLNDTMLYDARYGYIADVSRTIPRSKTVDFTSSDYEENRGWAWGSLWGGNIFAGAQNALDAGSASCNSVKDTSPATARLGYGDNHYWYGSNSISNAMQVVHIPQGMPKSSGTPASSEKFNGDGHLRIVIDIDDQQGGAYVNENAVFRIHLLDYEFGSTTFGLPLHDRASYVETPVLKSNTSISVASNGLYEIPIPSTYWTAQSGDERMIVSVDYDYLVALLRNRCGSVDTHLNGNDFSGVTYTTGHNTNSIFPLGMRKFGGTNNHASPPAGFYLSRDYMDKNAEWYAPRLHIVDDWNFAAATTVKYTDAQMGLVDEQLSIRSISWNIDGRNTESLNLGLERDVSRAAKNFTSYILPKVARGGVQSSGQGNQGGGGSNTGDSTGGGNTTGGREGDTGGLPAAGGWNDKNNGDERAGTKTTEELNPITDPNRTGTPDNLNQSTKSTRKLTSSQMNSNTLGRIKGVMDFNNDSVTGGAFAVLGQTKPSAAPRDGAGVSGIDSFIAPSSGDAIMGEDGMVFAGGGDWVAPPTSFVAVARIPPNSQSKSLRVFGRVSMGAATGNAVLLVTVQCVETGTTYTNTVTVESVERGSIMLFSGLVDGAEVSNNTIRVTIERNAGQGDDTATHSSLQLHNIQVATDNRAVGGKSQAGSFSYSD